MSSPFVQPPEPTADAAIEAIREEFEFLEEGMMQFTHLIDHAKKLPAFPAEWQDEAHLVPGCQAKVWLQSQMQDGRLLLAGTSNAALVAGAVGLLLRVYSGRTPREVLDTDPGFLSSLNLPELTSNRKNGVVAMIGRIRAAAQAGLAAA